MAVQAGPVLVEAEVRLNSLLGRHANLVADPSIRLGHPLGIPLENASCRNDFGQPDQILAGHAQVGTAEDFNSLLALRFRQMLVPQQQDRSQ